MSNSGMPLYTVELKLRAKVSVPALNVADALDKSKFISVNDWKWLEYSYSVAQPEKDAVQANKDVENREPMPFKSKDC